MPADISTSAHSSAERGPAFMPWGFAPLAGLVALLAIALAPFAFGEIEAAAQAAAQRALAEGGHDWAQARASGQWVVLEGRPPSQEAARQAIVAVKQARAPTLFGEAEPVTWVIDHLTYSEVALVDPAAPRPRTGGDAASPAQDSAAAACDASMASLLGTARIEFPTSSATPGAGSNALLDRIAQAALACPGRLRIEGHTDGVGREAANVALSRRRAEAVRAALVARGVPASRLLAEGHGDSRPIADNATEAGRARNRRIEIHAAPAPN